VGIIEAPITADTPSFADVPCLTQFYGHDSPERNPSLFMDQLIFLADNLSARVVEATTGPGRGAHSGSVILCFATDGMVDILMKTIRTMVPSIVLVVDNEQLAGQLRSEFLKLEGPIQNAAVFSVPKSGGVVERTRQEKISQKKCRVDEYFHGAKNRQSHIVKTFGFDDFEFYKYGTSLMSDVLPIGVDMTTCDRTAARVTPDGSMKFALMAVLHDADDMVEATVAGFVTITSVDEDSRRFTLMMPSQQEPPSRRIVIGSVRYQSS
jgi:polyribonucleotide 5'-hydroxyl-kinase